ncbi:retinol dehydrogenase 16-like isoform X2 [Microtus oregoni]|uniref:retinol dehydrogenase 16-like isoform X2 n=1 Tax=Microtus oregoni TaxID=111838 RepID=UPI001BB161ED|nr:retinol dehydrogenase 16-like isoform X2 [Microtus oregoni]
MWLYLVALVGLWTLLRLIRERQVVSHLQDKHVFITGCDSGFGNLLARLLDRRGMRVLAACLTEKGAEELRNKTSDRLETVILDVTKTESIVAATQWVKERVGNRGLWGLVNNAGISIPSGPNEWLNKEDFAKILDVNLLGVIEVTLSMLPLVRKARGRVVNVSSIMGRVSFFGGGYSISKYGVEAFSDSLRRELSYFGVKVAVVEPGFFSTGASNTDMHLCYAKMLWDRASSEVKEVYDRAKVTGPKVQQGPLLGDGLHGACADFPSPPDPIFSWLGCQALLHPCELPANLSCRCHLLQGLSEA